MTASTAGNDELLLKPTSYPPQSMPDHCKQEASGSITGGGSHPATATATLPPLTADIVQPVQGVADASVISPNSSMAEPVARSSSGTGDVPQPSLYPLCTMPDHRVQEASGSITGGANHPTIGTGTSSTLQHHTATDIVQDVADTSLNSPRAEPAAQSRSSSGTGDVPQPDEGITVSSVLSDSAVIRPDYIC